MLMQESAHCASPTRRREFRAMRIVIAVKAAPDFNLENRQRTGILFSGLPPINGCDEIRKVGAQRK